MVNRIISPLGASCLSRIHVIVAKRLGVARPAKRAGRSRIPARVAALCARPDQPVLLVIAERLAVRPLGQRRADGGDIACRVVAQALVGERRPVTDPAERVRRQSPIVIQLGRGVIERRARILADGGAGDRAEGAGCAAVADRAHEQAQRAFSLSGYAAS